MKRSRSISRRILKTAEPQLDVSSLIDVCFLLLIYFIVTTTIVKKEQDLDLSLRGEGLAGLEREPYVIEITSAGEVLVNPDIFPEVVASADSGSELPVLKDRLMLVQDSHGNDLMVQLRVAEGVDYQRFVDVLNCLTRLKIENAAIVDLASDI